MNVFDNDPGKQRLSGPIFFPLILYYIDLLNRTEGNSDNLIY